MSATPPTRHRPLPPPNRRRDKPQLSCNSCRRRKVKCDRQQPCRTCTLRGLAASCSYPPDATSRPLDRDANSTVQNRICELEGLVHTLMQRAASKNIQALPETTEGSPDSEAGASGELPNGGILTDSPAGVSYVDGAHWTALLDSISELKDYFQDGPESGPHYQIPLQPIPDYGPCPLLLYGRFAQSNKEEILSVLPTRSVADSLISKFFSSIDLTPGNIHIYCYKYNQFWEDPSATSIMWIGLLFAIMCFSTVLLQRYGDHDPGTLPLNAENTLLIRAYREKVVQCLTLGKYTRGGENVLQTLILYVGVEHFLQEDSDFGTHLLLSMIISIAMRMGYHRDPKNFPVISPFDGEMRRRTWAALYQANLIFATQMGLPSMLKDNQIDTEEPHNLADSDFDEGTTVLPSSRPETELTPVLYVITRSRISRLWEKVRDLATDTRPHTYEEILAMDQGLEADKRRIPPPLRMQPIHLSIADPPHLIMQRIWLDICFLRLKIVLHKKYFMVPIQNERYSYSREVCLKAAIEVLEYQHIVYELIKPGSLLYETRWKLSSVMNNEFLLATSIACAYVKQITDIPKSAVRGTNTEEVSKLLAVSAECWKRYSAVSRNARRAVKAINMVLKITSTPTASPASVEDELSPMFALQDPLLLDFNFPYTLDNFYGGDDSKFRDDPSLEALLSAQQHPTDDEWINLFQRVSTRPAN
ncbi:hypothetical protein F4813DRAFT_383088 [Daldinia decipiens]|uniref:uncharacterized protein n=1 Tax=Daldinia decipiens TaxID=326647 RepID=UPI0020C42080|nr:uncharacterized protein F4813DRAFT_383088 [Daldinia decipiens]KAI1653660.1 hypothetical protein F4813DRAFT_383088 [Daldinia decipiens]